MLYLESVLASNRINWPLAQEVSNSSTFNYNCHSYAWYWQSASNPYCIDYPGSYWADGSYTLIATGYNALIPSAAVPYACKVYYTGPGLDDLHSAVKAAGANLYVTSKWGAFAMYTHRICDCPYFVYGRAIQYYN